MNQPRSAGANKYGPSLFVRLRQAAFSLVERRLGKYITLHFRPLRSGDFNRASFPTPALPSYAVILQGPVVAKNDFTLETLRIYTKLFPGAPLIVSTWDNTSADTVAAMRAIKDVEVVLSELPPYRGYGNCNYQIASTAAGIRKAEDLGVTYVFKTRADQRMHATNLFPFLYGLLESFPLVGAGVPEKRLVALSYNTHKYRRYSLNDMFFFGTLKDIKRYWDIPYDMRAVSSGITVGEWTKQRVCEAYFFTTYLGNIGHDLQDTLEDYWDALGRYFIVVDPADLDWYWLKGARYQEYRDRRYDSFMLGEPVDFREWLMLAQGLGGRGPIPVNLDNLPNDMKTIPVRLE